MQLVQEYDLLDIIGEGVFGEDWKRSQVLIEVNDIAFSGENQLAALVGYSESQAASSSSPNSAKSYGVALLDTAGRSGNITVLRFIDMINVPVRTRLSLRGCTRLTTSVGCRARLNSQTVAASRQSCGLRPLLIRTRLAFFLAK